MKPLELEKALLEIVMKYGINKEIVGLEKRESPDFVCSLINGENIGIEITQSMLPYHGRVKIISERYGNRKSFEWVSDKIKNDKKLKLFLNNGIITYGNDITIITDANGLIDTVMYLKALIKQLNKKLIKLNNNYEVMDYNYLIVKPDGPILRNENDINYILNKLNIISKDYEILFDHIYIYTFDWLYLLKYNDGYQLVDTKKLPSTEI